MKFGPIEIKDKSNRTIVLRNATPEDAEDLITYLKVTTAETPYLIREPEEVAGLFNARIPLETEEEKRRALHDVICNMKENSIAYQSAHMNVTDMAALQKLMADKKSLERWKAGELPDFAF